MKKGIKILLLCGALLTAVVYFSCGGSGSSFDLFTTAEKTTPIILPSTTASVSSANWTMGNTLYEIYQLIREYKNDRDNGVIDGSNMHKALYGATEFVSSALKGCVEGGANSITEQAITSPFNFGDDLIAQTYNCAYNENSTGTPTTGGETTYTTSYAVKSSGGVYNVLVGCYYSQATQTSPSVIQLRYDSNTNDIIYNNAYFVNYTSGSMAGGSYNVRVYINGNTASHLFSLKLLKYSSGSPSIAGYGYSEGTDKYYLFKVDDINGTKYFCIPSNATEDTLKAMNDGGDPTPPDLCAGLVSGLPTNYKTDGSDSATSEASFKGTGDSHIILTWTK